MRRARHQLRKILRVPLRQYALFPRQEDQGLDPRTSGLTGRGFRHDRAHEAKRARILA